MHKHPVLEEAVENLMEYTGVYREIYTAEGKHLPIDEVERYQEGVREAIRGVLCKVALASSLDANLAQICSARNVKH